MNFFPTKSLKNGTSNFELTKWANYLEIPLEGVFMKDELYELRPKKNRCYIINLGDNKTLGGTHWTGLLIKENYCYYFDSYGVVPPVPVKAFVNKFKKPFYLHYSRQIVQDLSSFLCGQFVLFFFWFMQNNNNNYSAFLDLFDQSNTKKNDALLMNYMKKL